MGGRRTEATSSLQALFLCRRLGRFFRNKESDQDRGIVISESYLGESNVILRAILRAEVPDHLRRFRVVAGRGSNVSQQYSNETELNLSERLLSNELAANFEMHTNLSQCFPPRQLDFRSTGLPTP